MGVAHVEVLDGLHSPTRAAGTAFLPVEHRVEGTEEGCEVLAHV